MKKYAIINFYTLLSQLIVNESLITDTVGLIKNIIHNILFFSEEFQYWGYPLLSVLCAIAEKKKKAHTHKRQCALFFACHLLMLAINILFLEVLGFFFQETFYDFCPFCENLFI